MNICPQWRDALYQAALGAQAWPALEEHLKRCPACAAALPGLRRLCAESDAGVAQLARGPGPSPAFHGRLMAALPEEFGRFRRRRIWAAAAAAALLATGATLGLLNHARDDSLPPEAAAVVHWRSPTESLLRATGEDFLRHGPGLGNFYFPLQAPGAEPVRQRVPERSKNL